jgi:hypothetical protein
MVENCLQCKRNKAKTAEHVEFFYQCFAVSKFKNDTICQQCLVENFVRIFHAYAHVLKHRNGVIEEIYWDRFRKEEEKEDNSQIINLFVDLGIFCRIADEKWQITCDSKILLDQKIAMNLIYFTSFADAVNYAREIFQHFGCDWQIRKIDIAHSKDKILELGHLNRYPIRSNF